MRHTSRAIKALTHVVRDVGAATFCIKRAEEHIASDNLGAAVRELTTAQALDPHNHYINAILGRIDGIKKTESQAAQTDEPEDISPETKNRINDLTNAAEEFLGQGMAKLAFNALMEAYLIDPMNPRVIEREKHVLPAWERFRQVHFQNEYSTTGDSDVRMSQIRSVETRVSIQPHTERRGAPIRQSRYAQMMEENSFGRWRREMRGALGVHRDNQRKARILEMDNCQD